MAAQSAAIILSNRYACLCHASGSSFPRGFSSSSLTETANNQFCRSVSSQQSSKNKKWFCKAKPFFFKVKF
jgi:hypothetical protein